MQLKFSTETETVVKSSTSGSSSSSSNDSLINFGTTFIFFFPALARKLQLKLEIEGEEGGRELGEIWGRWRDGGMVGLS